jgi:hypothetical protein
MYQRFLEKSRGDGLREESRGYETWHRRLMLGSEPFEGDPGGAGLEIGLNADVVCGVVTEGLVTGFSVITTSD